MNDDFKSKIKVNEDKEKIRLLELQKKFKNGEIAEEEMDYDDYEKLLKLYDDQNEKLKAEIEKYKIETATSIKRIKK